MASPSIAILGADLLVAAAPVPLSQLVAAVEKLGFDAVAPASWGDELIAEAAVKYIAPRGDEPVALCTCPYAREALAACPQLDRFRLDLVSPPIATARYIRALYAGARVKITYLGDCPSAHDSSIDEVRRVEPVLDELRARNFLGPNQEKGSSPFGHRRFRSLPGGLPHATALRDCGGRKVLEIAERDLTIDVGRYAREGGAALMDLSDAVGCSCAGALTPGEGASGRARLHRAEPARASGEVLSPTVRPDITRGRPSNAEAPATRARNQSSNAPTADREIGLPKVQLGASEAGVEQRRTVGSAAESAMAFGGFIHAVQTGERHELPAAYLDQLAPRSNALPVAAPTAVMENGDLMGERTVPLEQVSRADEPRARRNSLGALTIQLPAIEAYRVPPPPTRSDTVLRIAGTAVLLLAIALALIVIS